MGIILASVPWKFSLVYLDDVMIFSKTIKVNLKHIDAVLRLLREDGVSLRLERCLLLLGPRANHIAGEAGSIVQDLRGRQEF